ncbi:hypothetical protein C8R45DRAFT_1185786 [Mycena sanguinolenta]|nr:hypothetical protein C8R45DRAFT_1185786 [Mycena sanguinolenta]
MTVTARKYNLTFTALLISEEIKLQMPVWKHISMNTEKFNNVRRKEAIKCLRDLHHVSTVGDIPEIAHSKTSPMSRRPHTINGSGIGRKSCGCPEYPRDRNEFGCKHTGRCIDTAEIILDAMHPKWNPYRANDDRCDELKLTDEERQQIVNECEEPSNILTFDPDFQLRNLNDGFRTFASDSIRKTVADA